MRGIEVTRGPARNVTSRMWDLAFRITLFVELIDVDR